MTNSNNMPYPALQVANAFVKKAIAEGKEISNLKLQKLLFLANGIHLVTSEEKKPLIDEPVAVWQYGPVVASVYHSFKIYGNMSIPTPSIEDQLMMWKTPLSEDAQNSIDAAWNVGKDASPIQLSNWSHNSGSPWARANLEHKTNIPDDYITEFFKPLVKK